MPTKRSLLAVVAVAAVVLGVVVLTRGDDPEPTAVVPDTVAVESRQLTEEISLAGSLEPLERTITHRSVADLPADDPPAVDETPTADAAPEESQIPVAEGAPVAEAEPRVATEVVAAPEPVPAWFVTDVPSVGDVIAPGDALYRVDGSPVLLLPGASPAWRTLEPDVTGSEVTQLETYLTDLGYDVGTVDDSFTTTTASAVAAWQSDLGLDATGTIPLGAVVFAPAAVTVTAVQVTVGDEIVDGDDVLDVAGRELEASLTVEPAMVSLVQPGQEFEVTVRGGPTVTAIVASVVVNPRGGAMAIAGLSEQPDLDVAPVSVTATRTTTATDDVLTVPAESIVKLDRGGYAVHLEDGTLVDVEITGSSGSTVAVLSDDLESGVAVRE